jgi:molecular chaperone DnaK
MQRPTIGIDLGTTNSVITVAEEDEIRVITNENDNQSTPSVVAFDGDKAIVGEQAFDQATEHPDPTVFSIKRFMGTDEAFFLSECEEGLSPEEVSALILKKLKQDAENEIGRSIEQAVITVPAYFDSLQRQATKHAGEMAGFDVDRIISDPTAACLTYGLRTDATETVLVYDLGGGTFDVSLIDINDGVFEVIATNGDTRLGGDDWDAAIVDWLSSQIERKNDSSFDENAIADRLVDAAQIAKHDLSEHTTTAITTSLEHNGTTYNIKQRLHRDQFERITRDLVEETISICEELLAEAGYRAGTIDEILLVGGSTRMPHVRERVTEYFGQEPSEQIDPDEAVAIGATVQAALIHDDSLPTLPEVSVDGSDTNEDSMDSSDTNGDDPSVLSIDDVVLLEVIPQSLGIETTVLDSTEESYEILIPDNSSMLALTTDIFTTTYDRQKYVKFPVYLGDNPAVEENELLNVFRIGPIPPRPAGVPNIRVEFQFDQNGIVQSSAEDMDHEIGDPIKIEPVYGFTHTELDTMKTELPQIR